jgi:hypothetical protein
MQTDSPFHFSSRDTPKSPEWAVTKKPQSLPMQIPTPQSACSPRPDVGGTSCDARYMKMKSRYYYRVLPADAMETRPGGRVGFVPPHMLSRRNESV